ncbi:MAG: hypothetical protein ACE5GN_04790, partial [Waddliaceae bacterium]
MSSPLNPNIILQLEGLKRQPAMSLLRTPEGLKSALEVLKQDPQQIGQHKVAMEYIFTSITESKELQPQAKTILDTCFDKGLLISPEILHQAVKNKNADLVKYLVDKGLDSFALDKHGLSCWDYAIQAKEEEVLDLLIEKLPQDPDKINELFTERDPQTNRSLLEDLFSEKFIDHVLKLRKKGLDTGLVSKDFRLPVEMESIKGDWVEDWEIKDLFGGRSRETVPFLEEKGEDTLKNFRYVWACPGAVYWKAYDSFLETIMRSKNQAFIENNKNLIAIVLALNIGRGVGEKDMEGLPKKKKIFLDNETLIRFLQSELGKSFVEGQLGKVLLHKAIESNNYEIAKFLIDSDVAVDKAYGTPLRWSPEKSNLDAMPTHTPLSHALLTHNYSLVDYLIEKDTVSSEGLLQILTQYPKRIDRSLAEYALDKGVLPQKVYELELQNNRDDWTLVYLLNQDVDINTKDQQGQTLLDHSLETTSWTLIVDLVEKGAAISEEQKKDIASRVDFLLSKPSELTPEEALRKRIDPKFLGLLVADAFMDEMKDKSGDKIEGSQHADTLPFLMSGIRFVDEKYPGKFTDKAKEAFKDLEKLYIKAAEFDSKLMFLRSLSEQKLPAAVEKLTKDAERTIKGLKIGEKVLFPSGWTDVRGGHTMLLQCERISEEECFFQVINTGLGIERFHLIDREGGRTFTDTVRYYKMSFHQMEEEQTIQKLIEARVLGARTEEDAERQYEAVDIYGPFEEHEVPEWELPGDLSDEWMQAQLGGTCGFRSVLAHIRSNIGERDYKTFVDLFKKEMIKMTIEKYGEEGIAKDEVLRTILLKAFPSLPRRLKK